jgi:DNA-binding transcriptional MerR regulator
MNEELKNLTVKAVAERTGVSVHTLRAWERRYGVPRPNREPGNHYRLYEEKDIADVLWMKRQIESGMTPAQASILLRQYRFSQSEVAAVHEHPLLETQTALESALLQSDEHSAREILDQAFAMYPIEEIALHVIQPTMEEIGEQWMRNQATVWQEHFATNIVRQKLLAVLHSHPVLPFSVPYLISACSPDEEHELGLLIFSLFARHHGWRVAYLGQRTPLASIANFTHTSQPTRVAISVGTVRGLSGLIDWLVPSNRPRTTLLFGGRLINVIPALRTRLPGAFLGEDALTAANALGTTQPPRPFWSPSQSAWKNLRALQARRLQIAGETVTRLLEQMPANSTHAWGERDLNSATLFLIDTLACAHIFDTPELIDLHRTWLSETLLSREVTPPLMRTHREIFTHVLTKEIGAGDARRFKDLLARMEENM